MAQVGFRVVRNGGLSSILKSIYDTYYRDQRVNVECTTGKSGTKNREPAAKGANIHSPQDGAWWALVTASKVGYGDTYPITAEGRMVAAGLIILSPVFLGILYAGIAATLLKPTLEEILDKERKEDERMARVVEKKFEEKMAQHFGPIKEQLNRMLEQKAQP